MCLPESQSPASELQSFHLNSWTSPKDPVLGVPEIRPSSTQAACSHCVLWGMPLFSEIFFFLSQLHTGSLFVWCGLRHVSIFWDFPFACNTCQQCILEEHSPESPGATELSEKDVRGASSWGSSSVLSFLLGKHGPSQSCWLKLMISPMVEETHVSMGLGSQSYY